MRILQITRAFAPSIGGIERHVAWLAEGLATAGDEVVVATSTPSPTPGRGYQVVEAWGRSLVTWIDWAEVVHLHGPALGGLVRTLAYPRPLVVTHHNYQAICPVGTLLEGAGRRPCPGWYREGWYERCLACAVAEFGAMRGAVCTAVAPVREALLERGVVNVAVSRHLARRLALPRTRVVPHGLPAREPLPWPGVGIAAYVGRLVPEKGVATLLSAAASRRWPASLQLRIVGDGPERANLEALARRLPPNRVRFLGARTGADLERVLAEVGVLVLPSFWEEAAGLAAIEHFWRGRVVVASAVGGLAEIVAGVGVLVPPGDPEALAAALAELVEAPEYARALGRAARRRAEAEHRLETMVARLRRLYERLVW